MPLEKQPVVYSAGWDGDKLVLVFKDARKSVAAGEPPQEKEPTKLIWSLSEDGKTLTIEESHVGPSGPTSSADIYSKQ